MGWEREKATGVLLASCVNAMAELVELVGNSGWMERSKEKVMGKNEESEGMLISCSPRPASKGQL